MAWNTRARLKEYDPRLAELLGEVFGDRGWRYVRPGARRPASAHLVGFEADAAPVFAWPEHLVAARERYFAGREFRVVPLVQPATAARIDWRSSHRGHATIVAFQNNAPTAVRVEWIDYEGRPQLHSSLRSGELTQSTTLSNSV